LGEEEGNDIQRCWDCYKKAGYKQSLYEIGKVRVIINLFGGFYQRLRGDKGSSSEFCGIYERSRMGEGAASLG
jgi:hypothetical protein